MGSSTAYIRLLLPTRRRLPGQHQLQQRRSRHEECEALPYLLRYLDGCTDQHHQQLPGGLGRQRLVGYQRLVHGHCRQQQQHSWQYVQHWQHLLQVQQHHAWHCAV